MSFPDGPRFRDAATCAWGAVAGLRHTRKRLRLRVAAHTGNGRSPNRRSILHVWSYGESAGDLPNLVQKLSSLKDIASRLG